MYEFIAGNAKEAGGQAKGGREEVGGRVRGRGGAEASKQ